MARNSDYSEIILKLTEDYFNLKRPSDDEVLPTIEGLALYLKVARSTIYEWMKDVEKQEFSDTVEAILAKQGLMLMNKGLTNEFTPTIAKLMLSSNHGMSERTDITSGGKRLAMTEEEKIAANKALENTDE